MDLRIRCQENTATSGVRTFSFVDDETDRVIGVGGATWWEDWPSFLESFQAAGTPDLSPYAEACPGWARNPPENRVTRGHPEPPPARPVPDAPGGPQPQSGSQPAAPVTLTAVNPQPATAPPTVLPTPDARPGPDAPGGSQPAPAPAPAPAQPTTQAPAPAPAAPVPAAPAQ